MHVHSGCLLVLLFFHFIASANASIVSPAHVAAEVQVLAALGGGAFGAVVQASTCSLS
jgi:hypothetical protein